jgi:hypothetical protein
LESARVFETSNARQRTLIEEAASWRQEPFAIRGAVALVIDVGSLATRPCDRSEETELLSLMPQHNRESAEPRRPVCDSESSVRHFRLGSARSRRPPPRLYPHARARDRGRSPAIGAHPPARTSFRGITPRVSCKRMSIRKRNDRWEVRIRLGAGRRIEKTLPPGATRADALAVEAAHRRAKIDGVVGRRPRRTIADAMDQWEATGARALRSWQKDLRFRAGVVRQLADNRLIDDLPELAADIQRYGSDSGLSSAGTNRYLAIVRRVARLCEQWGWTDRPIGRRIQLLPGKRPRETNLTVADVRLLASKADPRLRDLIVFQALTGLRRSEALRLTAANLVDGCVRVDSRSKNGKPRLVSIGARGG